MWRHHLSCCWLLQIEVQYNNTTTTNTLKENVPSQGIRGATNMLKQMKFISRRVNVTPEFINSNDRRGKRVGEGGKVSAVE